MCPLFMSNNMPSNGLDVVVRLPCEKRSLLSVHDLEGEPVVCIMERPRKSLESLRVDCRAKWIDWVATTNLPESPHQPLASKLETRTVPKTMQEGAGSVTRIFHIPHGLDPRPGEKSPIHLMGSTAGLSCGETGVVCVV